MSKERDEGKECDDSLNQKHVFSIDLTGKQCPYGATQAKGNPQEKLLCQFFLCIEREYIRDSSSMIERKADSVEGLRGEGQCQ